MQWLSEFSADLCAHLQENVNCCSYMSRSVFDSPKELMSRKLFCKIEPAEGGVLHSSSGVDYLSASC